MTGYTAAQLDDIQGKWNLRFPPDLLEVYRRRRRVIDNELGFDWLKTPTDNIRKQLQWPLTGMLFDIEKNDFWLPEWGERPSDASDRHDIARSAIAAAPKLIPIHGHRCIPETPHKAGNPIFSVWQTDSIHYGANLDDYIARENGDQSAQWPPCREIPFWSRLVRLNSGIE